MYQPIEVSPMAIARVICFAFILSLLCRANSVDLQRLYNETCSTDSPSPALGKNVVSAINTLDINEMSGSEISDVLQALLPCLTAKQVSVQQLGLLFVISAETRVTNVPLLSSNIKALETLASDSSSPLQNEALQVLVTMRPHISKDVISYLQSRLTDIHLRPEIAAPIVVALLEAGNDDGSASQILAFADSQSDASV